MRNIKHELLVLNPTLLLGTILNLTSAGCFHISGLLDTLSGADMFFISAGVFIGTSIICSLFHNCFLIFQDYFIVYKSILGFKFQKLEISKSNIKAMQSYNNGMWSIFGHKWVDLEFNNGQAQRLYCFFYPCETMEDVENPKGAGYLFEDLHGEFYTREYPISWWFNGDTY